MIPDQLRIEAPEEVDLGLRVGESQCDGFDPQEMAFAAAGGSAVQDFRRPARKRERLLAVKNDFHRNQTGKTENVIRTDP